MTLNEFIKKYRSTIDEKIGKNLPMTDRIRELWVLHDDELYAMARREGVDI